MKLWNLFKPNEKDKALAYIIDSYMENNDNDDSIGLSRMVLKGIFETTYGVNVTKMANAMKVQTESTEWIIPSLMSYLECRNEQAELVVFNPVSALAPILLEKIHENGYEPWDPKKRWDFNRNMSMEETITNPLLGFSHSYLLWSDINTNMAKKLYRCGLISVEDIRNLDSGRLNYVTLKLLPTDNFNQILQLSEVIFENV